VGERRVPSREERAAVHAALGDPLRLSIVDELAHSDRSPTDLASLLGVAPPLVAFHLDTLERVGLIRRIRSSGDRRRRYVQLVETMPTEVSIGPIQRAGTMTFVCTHNSARSQLAAALWRRLLGGPARSAGTEPAEVVHPGAVAAARRNGLDLSASSPSRYRPTDDEFVVTVCDRAREQLGERTRASWHWSLPDPTVDGTDAAFDDTIVSIQRRIALLQRAGTPPTVPTPVPEDP